MKKRDHAYYRFGSNELVCNLPQERSLLALSSRTGADWERQQRIGYDAFAEPTMNERYLR